MFPIADIIVPLTRVPGGLFGPRCHGRSLRDNPREKTPTWSMRRSPGCWSLKRQPAEECAAVPHSRPFIRQ